MLLYVLVSSDTSSLIENERTGDNVATRGCVQVKFAGLDTYREREYDHEECEGCGRRDKPVYSYLGKDGEPIVCNKRICWDLAMIKRFGGVRKHTKEQQRQFDAEEQAKEARRRKSTAPVRQLRAV